MQRTMLLASLWNRAPGLRWSSSGTRRRHPGRVVRFRNDGGSGPRERSADYGGELIGLGGGASRGSNGRGRPGRHSYDAPGRRSSFSGAGNPHVTRPFAALFSPSGPIPGGGSIPAGAHGRPVRPVDVRSQIKGTRAVAGGGREGCRSSPDGQREIAPAERDRFRGGRAGGPACSRRRIGEHQAKWVDMQEPSGPEGHHDDGLGRVLDWAGGRPRPAVREGPVEATGGPM